MTVLKQQLCTEKPRKTHRKVWKPFPEDGQVELKAWVDTCKGKNTSVMNFAVLLESQPIVLRNTVAERLEAFGSILTKQVTLDKDHWDLHQDQVLLTFFY